MFLPDFSIRRPVAATMMVSALVVFGLIGMTRLGVSLYPDVDFPMVTVTTVWENARPEEVDNEITDRLEDAISSVSGIKHINSASMQGVSRIIVEFELSKDVDVAAQEVRDKVSTKLRELPKEADSPVIDKLDINAQPIIWLAVRGPQAIETLTKVADEQLRPLIQKIQGVGEVRVGGARKKEVHIWLDRERLAAYNLGVNDVITALVREHVEVPGGKIESKDKEFLIRTVGEFPTPEAFNRMIVAFRNNYPVRLEDLGKAKSAREESVGVARFTTKATGGMRSVGLGISPRSGANEVAIAQKVRQVLPELRRVAPEGIVIDIATDTTIFTEQSIDEVQFQLLLGAIIAALIIFLFLQNLRTTLISAVAIPTSIISTFACMYWMGFTMNNMSMLALVTAVGLVIDDAIVMVENIFRHRTELKQGAMEAAFEGSSEIAFAVVATTVALGGVFLPVAFMGGMVGRFFYEFAVTLAFSVVCSTFVALTVVPMLSARFLTVSETSSVFNLFNRMMDATSHYYRWLIDWCLRHRLTVMAAALAALLVGGWVFTMLGKEFVSAEDEGRFMVRLETPLSYSLEKTDSVLQRLEKEMIKVPEIDHFFSVSGYDGSNKAIAMVTLTPKAERQRNQTDLQNVVRGLLRELPDVRGTVSRISPLGAGSRNEDIQFVIQGPEIDKIDRYSRQLMERLQNTRGYVGITRNLEIGKPEVRVKIDRARAADAGVSVSEVANAVAALLGGVKTVDFREGGKSYDVRVRLMEDQRVLPNDVQRIWLRAHDGRLLDVSGFVTLEQGVGPNIINRLDRSRSATIYANLDGKLLGEAMPEVQALADKILPDGYSTTFVGRAEAFAETTHYIAFAFLLAIVLTYMVLAAQFESFAHPLSIMMGLPLSFIGAFGLLFLLGNSFNLFSMIGLILLVGLATKNGILLIDYTKQLREKGMGVHDALVEAGAVRLRPILMTAVSTIGGVLPVVLALGVGSESRQPMAVAIAGGMISSTVLTLLVVPVVYSYLDQLANWRMIKRVQHRFMAPDAIKDNQGQPPR